MAGLLGDQPPPAAPWANGLLGMKHDLNGLLGMPSVADQMIAQQRLAEQVQREKGFVGSVSDPRLAEAGMGVAGNFDFTGALPGGMIGSVKAYHSTFDDFDKFDFSKVGSFTKGNVTDTDPNSWSMRLARLGAWFSGDDISSAMAAPIVKQAELAGKAKSFGSLDKLSSYVERTGGSMKARKALRDSGFDLVKVKDEEFGTTSYVALHPRAIESLETKK
jgi:hypothetical protein